jgi:transcriptional regulator with XRE-family HTH domain
MRFSQEEAATFLRVSRQNYVRWELGEREPEPLRWFLIDEATRGAVPWHSWTSETAADLIDSVVRRYAQRQTAPTLEQSDTKAEDPPAA